MMLEDAEFYSVDLETTGLDVRRDEIIAFAGIPVLRTRIAVGEGRYMLIRPDKYRLDAMRFHGISEGELEKAPKFKEVGREILEMLNGILVGHCIRFDYDFLRGAFKKSGVKFAREILDISNIEKWLSKDSLAAHELTFDNMIRRYGLKEYYRHNALSDAFFAAQIFQMQLDRLMQAGVETTEKLLEIECSYSKCLTCRIL